MGNNAPTQPTSNKANKAVWCNVHDTNSHSNAECHDQQNGKAPRQRNAAHGGEAKMQGDDGNSLQNTIRPPFEDYRAQVATLLTLADPHVSDKTPILKGRLHEVRLSVEKMTASSHTFTQPEVKNVDDYLSEGYRLDMGNSPKWTPTPAVAQTAVIGLGIQTSPNTIFTGAPPSSFVFNGTPNRASSSPTPDFPRNVGRSREEDDASLDPASQRFIREFKRLDLNAQEWLRSFDFSAIRDWSPEAQQWVVRHFQADALAQRTHEQRRIDAHCERSTRLYKKENYLHWIRTHQEVLLQNNTLACDQSYNRFMFALAQGLQLWRDPQALKNIASKRKPNCNGCNQDGHFLDRWFREILVNANVLDIQDFDDWGVFVAFECGCRNQGYSYVSRPDFEL